MRKVALQRRMVFPLLLTAAIISGAYATGSAAVGADQDPDIKAGPVIGARKAPTVTVEAKALSKRTAERDPLLKRIFKLSTPATVDEGPWTDNSQNVLGTVRRITLTKTVDVPVTSWPLINWSDASDTYTEVQFSASVSGLKEFEVLIDEKKGKVVSILPQGDAIMTTAK